jgi:hypothetical protein
MPAVTARCNLAIAWQRPNSSRRRRALLEQVYADRK